MDRSTCLERWRASSARGTPILGAGAGTGISAKCAEAAGADLIIIYNSGRYRMAGRGSLAGLMPYGDANAIVMEMAREVLPIVRKTPVLAGVCGTDPFRVMDLFLRDLKQLGFSGVQNFPTVGLIDGLFRENLEETGMGYIQEVEMIARAHQLDLLTCPYVFNEDEARAMAEAGADLLIAHMGLTTKGPSAPGRRSRSIRRLTAFRSSSKRPLPYNRRFWSSVMAARSPSRKTFNTSSIEPTVSADSSGLRASSVCPRSVPLLSR